MRGCFRLLSGPTHRGADVAGPCERQGGRRGVVLSAVDAKGTWSRARGFVGNGLGRLKMRPSEKQCPPLNYACGSRGRWARGRGVITVTMQPSSVHIAQAGSG